MPLSISSYPEKLKDALLTIGKQEHVLHSLKIVDRQPYIIKCLATLLIRKTNVPLPIVISLKDPVRKNKGSYFKPPNRSPIHKLVYLTTFTDTGEEVITSYYEAELWCRQLQKSAKGAKIALMSQEHSQNIEVRVRVWSGKRSDFAFIGKVSAQESYRFAKLLAYGIENGFKWPSTEVDDSLSELRDIEAPEIGYLKYLGYTVGVNGRTYSERKRILTRAYSSDLPSNFPESEIKQWGSPGTCRRLKKCADCLASFARNLKRKDMKNAGKARRGEYSQAVIDWERDLAWMKSEYYDPCSFTWPNTNV